MTGSTKVSKKDATTTRRGFVAAAAAGAAASALPAPAIAQGAVRWKMVTTWPRNFPGMGTGAQRIADRIGELTDGRMEVRLYAAGELVPAFEAFDAVRDGIAEMTHDASYYWVAKHKSTPFFCTVPGGLTHQEHMGWIYRAGGQALWDELYAGFGLRAFLAGGTGVQMGGWFQREIVDLESLKGLKMRIPGLGGEVVNRLGVTAVNLPGGEIMAALQSGVIDATEWVGPWNDLAFGFHKVAKFYYGPGFHEPSAALEVIVDSAKFDALPREFQAAVEYACMAENGYMLSEFTAANSAAQAVLTRRYKVNISPFPADVVQAAYSAAADVVAETASEGDLERRIYESWSIFRREAMARAPYAEHGYMNDRALGVTG